MGSAVHEALGANFGQKIDTRTDLPAAGVQAVYLEAWDKLVRGDMPNRFGKPSLPTEFRDDELPGELKAQGLALSLKYLEEAAPKIQPTAVELPVTGTIAGVRVRGFIDLLDDSGRIIDIKTGAKKPNEISSDYKFQVASYSQICDSASGHARVDTLVKTKSPQLVHLDCTIDQKDVDATQKLYPLVQNSIRADVWLPNRSHFMCSRRSCGFWRACEREFGGTVGE